MIENFGYAILVPFVVSFLVALRATYLPDQSGWARFGRAMAVPFGFSLGFVLVSWTSIIPKDPTDWLFYLGLAGGITGVVWSRDDRSWLESWSLMGWLSLMSVCLLLPDWLELEGIRVAVIAALTGALMLLGLLLGPLVRRSTGPLMPVVFLLSTIVGSVVIGLALSLKYAQMSGMVAASLGATVLVSLFRGTRWKLVATIPVWIVIQAGLVFETAIYSFSDIPKVVYGLIPIAPGLLWLVEIGPLRSIQGWRRWLLCLLLVSIPLGIPLGWAITDFVSAGD